MSGNAMELVYDLYGIYDGYDQENPTGAATGANRVGKGGDISANRRMLRWSYRQAAIRQDTGYNNVGFRLAADK